MNNFAKWIVFSVGISTDILRAIYATPSGYDVYQKLTLNKSQDGIDAILEVLKDRRINQTEIAHLKERPFEDGENGRRRFKNAVLELIAKNGQVTESTSLEKPLADIETVDLNDKLNRAIMVTQDFRAPFGSFSGPTTLILQISSDSGSWKLSWAKAKDKNSGRRSDILLMRSLKSTWRYSRGTRGAAQDILLAACSIEDPGTDEFVTTYSRFRRSSNGWIVDHRQRTLPCEFDKDEEGVASSFPDLKEFP